MTSLGNYPSPSPARGLRLVINLMAFVCTLFGVGTFYLTQHGAATYPAIEKLSTVSGTVSWVRRDEDGADFQFEGDVRYYTYSKNGGEWRHVASIIADKSSGPISVLIDPEDERHPPVGHPFFQVRGVFSNGGAIRSYEQVRNAWLKEYRWGYPILVLMLVLAALGYRIGWRLKEEPIGTRANGKGASGV